MDKTGGDIAWRFYGPREQADAASDLGALLVRGSLIYWQVDNTVYALNTQTGQVEWRDAIPEVDAKVSTLEEGQMAVGQGVLLIRRSDMYHALDLVTGAEHWTLSGLGVDDTQTPGGIIADGSKFILYGGGTIEAANGVAQIPLFVKGGTLLPLAEPVEFTKPDTCFNVAVNIVGAKPSDFTLFEDDGVTGDFANGGQNRLVLHVDGDQHSVQRAGNYHGPERFKITDWKAF